MTPLGVQGNTVPQWKALRFGNYEIKWLSCCSPLSISQDALKSGNLLHKQGFVDSLMHTTVNCKVVNGPLFVNENDFENTKIFFIS